MKKSGSWTVAGALLTLALLIGMSVHAYRLSQGVAVQEAVLERAKEQFDAKLQEASEKLDRARQSAEQAAAERDRLAAQIATITTASNSLGRQLSEKSKQIEQLEASLAETRQTLARAGEDRRQLDEVAESRSGRITELESDRERLQTDLRTVESDLESTAARLEEKAVMLLSLGAAQLQARQALDKAESASEALNRELSASRARGDELEAKNSVLRRQLEQENITNAQMSSDLDGLRLAFAELEDHLGRARSSVQQLTAETRRSESEVAELKTQRSRVLGERDELSRQLQTQRHALSAKEDELAVLLSQTNQAIAQNQELTRRNDELKHALAQATSDGDRLRLELSTRTVESDRLREELSKLEDTATDLEREFALTSGDLEHARSKAADLTQEYDLLLRQSANVSRLNESQRQQLESARLAIEVAQSGVARLTNARGIYTVQEGDSLSKIAVFFYRNGHLWTRIVKANHHLIGDDPDLIFAKMVLIIP